MIQIPCTIRRSDAACFAAFGRSLPELLAAAGLTPSDARLIVDERVWMHHKTRLLNLPGITESRVVTVPSGETSKDLSVFSDVCERLLASGIRRTTVLYVCGGGVTGDLGGFVAASLLRGLPLIQLPTTVLAMVDSAFGGKTGVNSKSGKNLIGAFYQPRAVLADLTLLESLPEDEWRNGLGEIVKYGLIEAGDLLDMDWNAIRSSPSELERLLARCAAIKTGIVERDETESGERAFLNLGHTFAHAMETATGYTHFKHGEAVFYGLIAALELSRRLGAPVDPAVLDRFRPQFPFSLRLLQGREEALTSLMAADKKNRTEAAINFVVLKRYGQPAVQPVQDRALIQSVWTYLLNQSA